MLPAAWLAAKAAPYIAGAAVVLALMAALAIAYSKGYDRAADRYTAEIATTALRQADAVAAAERRARQAEQTAAGKLAALKETHHREQANAKTNIEKLRTDLRAATVRLSIPAKCPAAPGADTGASAGSGAETRAELLPAASDDLVRIAGECDAVVRERNALIDRYNAVLEIFNRQGVADN